MNMWYHLKEVCLLGQYILYDIIVYDSLIWLCIFNQHVLSGRAVNKLHICWQIEAEPRLKIGTEMMIGFDAENLVYRIQKRKTWSKPMRH